MNIKNLIQKQKRRTFLSFGMPKMRVNPSYVTFDFEELYDKRWIDSDTEFHICSYGDMPNYLDQGEVLHHLGSYAHSQRYVMPRGKSLRMLSIYKNDHMQTSVTYRPYNSMAFGKVHEVSPLVNKYGTRTNAVHVTDPREIARNIFEIPTKTRDIQTVSVFHSMEDYTSRKAPIMALVDLQHNSLRVSLNESVTSFYMVIYRGNTDNTVMDGLKYKGHSEHSLSVIK